MTNTPAFMHCDVFSKVGSTPRFSTLARLQAGDSLSKGPWKWPLLRAKADTAEGLLRHCPLGLCFRVKTSKQAVGGKQTRMPICLHIYALLYTWSLTGVPLLLKKKEETIFRPESEQRSSGEGELREQGGPHLQPKAGAQLGGYRPGAASSPPLTLSSLHPSLAQKCSSFSSFLDVTLLLRIQALLLYPSISYLFTS